MEILDKEWFYWGSPQEVPDMGRVVQLEYGRSTSGSWRWMVLDSSQVILVQLEGGCSTSGRWFLAWVGWFYVCKSSVRGAVLNVSRGGSTLQGDFDPP